VLELARTRADVVVCLADAEALDALERPRGSLPIRVAPDELLLIAHPGAAHALERAARTLRGNDDDALVMDVSDGWTAWSIAGPGSREAFGRLSMLHLPRAGVVQGDVARLPVKVVADGDRLHLLVPSSWSEHLRERIVALVPDVREDAEPRAWTAPRARHA
jgi:hypothetical protein